MGRLFLSLFLIAVIAELGVASPLIYYPDRAMTIYSQEGATVDLECKAEGNPEYGWRLNGRPVETGSNVVVDSKTGGLEIKTYSDMNDGYYQCVATDGLAYSVSQKQRLRQIVLPSFKGGIPATPITIPAYSYLRLNCSGKMGGIVAPNDIHYHWYIGEASTEITSKDSKNDGRRFVDQNGDLHFAFVTAADAADADSSMYKCGFTSNTVSTAKFRSPYLLNVKKTNPAGSSPVLQYRSHGAKGLIGTSAVLECFFSGYDSSTANHLPTVKWFDPQNVEITPQTAGQKYELGEFNHRLIVKNLKQEDEKSYYCQGFTQSGNTDKYTVSLNVTSKPQFVVPPSNQFATEGSDAVFNCVAKSLAGEEVPGTPRWFINGKQLDLQDVEKFALSTDKQKLTIKHVERPQDIVCVQCEVANSVGELMGDACLNVVPPIVMVTSPPKTQKIKRGDLVDLTFKATYDDDDISHPESDKRLSYEWTIANVIYQNKLPDYVTQDATTGETYINTSQLSDKTYNAIGGRYSFRAFNIYGSKTATTDVSVTDHKPPSPAKAASAGFPFWIIGVVIGILLLFAVAVMLFVAVFRNKRQEGDYNVDKKEVAAGYNPEQELLDKGFNDLSRPLSDEYAMRSTRSIGDLVFEDVPISGEEDYHSTH